MIRCVVSITNLKENHIMATINTKNFKIFLPQKGEKYGRFENDAIGYFGGLTFNQKTLTDYDGVYSLPLEIAQALKEYGFVVAVDGIDGVGGIPA